MAPQKRVRFGQAVLSSSAIGLIALFVLSKWLGPERWANADHLAVCALVVLLLCFAVAIMLTLRKHVLLLDRRTDELTKAHTRLQSEVAERQRIEQHLALQYAVTRVLAEATTLDEAAPRILHAVCECLGWVFGGMWCHDAQALRCVSSLWSAVGKRGQAHGGYCDERSA